MKTQEYLVTINVPPLLEEAIVDCLLAFNSDGFSSLAVNAHSTEHEKMSLAEQVAGRQRQIRFQMYIPAQDLDDLIKRLKGSFSGAGIHYWVSPVIESAYI